MSEASWARTRTAFDEAADWYVRTSALAGGRWDEPGLGVWTVRDLVGHTSRSLLTVEAYVQQSAPGVELSSPGEYFRAAMASIADPEAVAQRGRDAAAALGADVPSAVATIADRVRTRLDACGPDDLVGTPVGGMRLADYLPTRTFELTVHTADLCTALGLPTDVPPGPARASLELVAELASARALAGPLLLAVTGRRGLPEGFTVL